jgi:hypothetical protein
MDRIKDLEDIRKVLFDYCPEKTRYDLEQWILSILLNTYVDVNLIDLSTIIFKFNNTHILFINKHNVFNLTKINTKNELMEYSLTQTSYLKENYGLTTLQEIDKILLLSDDDFDLMSEQLAAQIIEWDMNTKALDNARDTLCSQMVE